MKYTYSRRFGLLLDLVNKEDHEHVEVCLE